MKDRKCNYCKAEILKDGKITTSNGELLSMNIYEVEHNWCNDDCCEKWFDDFKDTLTYVNKPCLYFKD